MPSGFALDHSAIASQEDRARLGAVLQSFSVGIALLATKFWVDAHVVVPEFWTVSQAHDLRSGFTRHLIEEFGSEGEITFHTDPCPRAYCAQCDLAEHPVRREAFQARPDVREDARSER